MKIFTFYSIHNNFDVIASIYNKNKNKSLYQNFRRVLLQFIGGP